MLDSLYTDLLTALFSDAKTAENDAQKIICSKFASYLAERLLSQTELFSEQFKCWKSAFNYIAGFCNMFLSVRQSAQMALASNEYVLSLVPACNPQQLLS